MAEVEKYMATVVDVCMADAFGMFRNVFVISRLLRKMLMSWSIPCDSCSFQDCQKDETKSSGKLCMVLLPSRWGNFWRVQVLKSLMHVCTLETC